MINAFLKINNLRTIPKSTKLYKENFSTKVKVSLSRDTKSNFFFISFILIELLTELPLPQTTPIISLFWNGTKTKSPIFALISFGILYVKGWSNFNGNNTSNVIKKFY